MIGVVLFQHIAINPRLASCNGYRSAGLAVELNRACAADDPIRVAHPYASPLVLAFDMVVSRTKSLCLAALLWG